MNIRPYTNSDYRAVLGIYALSKLDELRFELAKFELLSLEDDEKRHSGLLESDIYVYEEEVILGYGAIFGDEVRALYVHPSARGRGVGRSLLECMLSLVAGPIRLNVVKTNVPAIRLYRQYGFETINEVQCFYNGKPVVAVTMSRQG